MSVRPRIRPPASGVLLLLLLSALGHGAEEQGPLPRKIVGGELASEDDYPFVVKVWKGTKGWGNYCTGSILAPRWVLTAAHCLIDDATGNKLPKVQIEHGLEHSLGQGRTLRNSKQVLLHPQFNSNYFDHDLGLVEVAEAFPASYSASLGIPSLTTEDRYAAGGVTARALGYGGKANLLPTDDLQFFNWTLYRYEKCRTWPFLSTLGREEICTEASGKRLNFGDSGGPAVVAYTDDGKTKYLQVGVNQRIVLDQSSSKYGSVFMRVSLYAAWIRTTTGNTVSYVDVENDDDGEGEGSGNDDGDDGNGNDGGDDGEGEDNTEQLLISLRQTEAKIRSLQATVQSLRSNRDEIRGVLNEIKVVDGQVKGLHTKTDGILRSASTTLAK